MENKPLKIYIIGPAFPLRGGPAQFNENLCAALNKAGHRSEIISYSLQYPNFLFPGSSQFETSGAAPSNIKIHTLINSINPFNWIKVARFINKQQPDFILFRFWLPFFGPSLGSIGRLVNKRSKVLALTDNVVPHEKRFGDNIFTRYFVKSCDGFIAMSRSVLKDISKFSDNPHKAYSPHPMYETYGEAVSMEEARRKLNLNNDDKIILFFGLIRHYKGLDLLIEAMAAPEIKRLNIKLLIAGEFYEDKTPYLNLIKKHQLQDLIILHDRFIANDEVKFYFCASNLVAQTYRNATNSGVTMVGYFYEKPMLVSNVGGLAEIVPDGKCGYVVEPLVQIITDKIVDYFAEKREATFTKNIAIEKKKFEWEAFVTALLKLHKSTLD